MGKAGLGACSLQREFFMGSEGLWERQGVARVCNHGELLRNALHTSIMPLSCSPSTGQEPTLT
jgi:hypothetical protein